MGRRLGSGSLMGKERLLLPHFKLIFTLKTRGFVAFGHLGNFPHVKFKTGQLIVYSLSKRELALGVLDCVGLFEVFDVEYTLRNISGALLEEGLNGGVLANGFL